MRWMHQSLRDFLHKEKHTVEGRGENPRPFSLQNDLVLYIPMNNGAMIYLSNIRAVQTAYIPRSMETAINGPVVLSMRSTIDLTETSAAIISSEQLPLYWRVRLIVPGGMACGEYEYELSSGGRILSSGIITLTWEREVYEHNNVIEYEQYGG